MGSFVLKVFDYVRTHRLSGVLIFAVLTALLLLSIGRISFKEDISDFLPLDEASGKAMDVYQEISGASTIVAIFQTRDGTLPDPDEVVAAIDSFSEAVREGDSTGMVLNLTDCVDIDSIFEVSDFVFANAPYFMLEEDYVRADSLLSQPGYVRKTLEKNKRSLMFSAGGMLARTMAKDPLGLFQPVADGLQTGYSGNVELYDGCIFSQDMSRAVVTMESAFGSSETKMNSKLTAFLEECAGKAEIEHDNLEVHLTGGPVIAVGNSTRIKKDSLWSVALALVLIIPLLYISFRNLRNLSLIIFSLGWGWLFALGALALIHSSISAIVVGISSAILGIAANYPLHLIAHLSYNPDRRSSLKDIVTPLVVGNITTVGAFLALVPLHSVSLRDLGLFSSFLLVGTIFFVLVFLPHLAKPMPGNESRLISFMGGLKPEKSRPLVAAVLLLTLVFAYFSKDLEFDSDMSHINYMTQTQRADMEYFQENMSSEGALPKVYVVCSDVSADAALDKSLAASPCIRELVSDGLAESSVGCSRYIASKDEQLRRISRWERFVEEHRDILTAELSAEAKAAGFAEESFRDFQNLLTADLKPMETSDLEILTSTVFASSLITDERRGVLDVVDVLSVEEDRIAEVKDCLEAEGLFCFDAGQMNRSIAGNLSDDFNYIGWACSLIVFFFLWLSFGSFELALLSFLPMAVSWLWILGIMSMLGMQFNIVNVILATFIFGQGDDYTIFMTEGACYEYTRRRKILDSYKNSIVISALIMFAGIGSLIIAKHPAMRSLGEVTIVGMLSVVLMAYLFPPLVYGFLVRKHGQYRSRPVSLLPVLRRAWLSFVELMFRMFRSGALMRLVPGVKVSVSGVDAAEGTFFCASEFERMCVLSAFPDAKIADGQSAASYKVFGAAQVRPEDDFMLFRGTVVIAPCTASGASLDYGAYARDLVLDRFRYKEAEIFRAVKRTLSHGAQATAVEEGDSIRVAFDGYGETALLYALEHPDRNVVVECEDEEKRDILRYCAEGVAPNLKIMEIYEHKGED